MLIYEAFRNIYRYRYIFQLPPPGSDPLGSGLVGSDPMGSDPVGFWCIEITQGHPFARPCVIPHTAADYFSLKNESWNRYRARGSASARVSTSIRMRDTWPLASGVPTGQFGSPAPFGLKCLMKFSKYPCIVCETFRSSSLHLKTWFVSRLPIAYSISAECTAP